MMPGILHTCAMNFSVYLVHTVHTAYRIKLWLYRVKRENVIPTSSEEPKVLALATCEMRR